MPPRLGGPASAPHNAGGRERGRPHAATPAARLAFSSARRLISLAWTRGVCGVGIGDPSAEWSGALGRARCAARQCLAIVSQDETTAKDGTRRQLWAL